MACGLYYYWYVYVGQYKLEGVLFLVNDYKIEDGSCNHWESTGCYKASLVGTIAMQDKYHSVNINATVTIPRLTGIRQSHHYIEQTMIFWYKKHATIRVHTTIDYTHGVTELDTGHVWMVISIVALFNLCMTCDSVKNDSRRKYASPVVRV